MTFHRGEHQEARGDQHRLADAIEGHEGHDGEDGKRAGASEIRDEVQHTGEGAPQHRIRHAEQPHHQCRNRAEQQIDHGQRAVVTADLPADGLDDAQHVDGAPVAGDRRRHPCERLRPCREQ